MNHYEAKFILQTLRPDGSDAQDPVFAEPLVLAEQDPALKAWLVRETALDLAIAAKLREVLPPADLRAIILAGGRASQRRRRWWNRRS